MLLNFDSHPSSSNKEKFFFWHKTYSMIRILTKILIHFTDVYENNCLLKEQTQKQNDKGYNSSYISKILLYDSHNNLGFRTCNVEEDLKIRPLCALHHREPEAPLRVASPTPFAVDDQWSTMTSTATHLTVDSITTSVRTINVLER
ncbi:hypothetical protein L6452_19164 [Arctium lappa]|uniref:Uncharacterized protein n=1 Tax=Arctium lappa TaxID=4217 RepID=A0ACB9BCA3_ARCLA|nr:hypothetical protein L6452_19164 [Arctium lappa]